MSLSDDQLSEEARAQAWREQARTRVAYQRAVWAGLQAPPELRAAVIDAWMPIILADAERQSPTDPKDDP